MLKEIMRACLSDEVSRSDPDLTEIEDKVDYVCMHELEPMCMRLHLEQ